MQVAPVEHVHTFNIMCVENGKGDAFVSVSALRPEYVHCTNKLHVAGVNYLCLTCLLQPRTSILRSPLADLFAKV